MAKKKPILCVDFDGVIHSYTSGFRGHDIIPDDPVPGAFDALKKYIRHFHVAIFSSRSASYFGREAMKAWFHKHGWECKENPYGVKPVGLEFPINKPPAFLTIDDRAFLFEGVFPSAKTLLEFKTWQKK